MIQILPMAFLCIEVSGLEVRTFLLKISWFCWKPVYWALPRRVHPVKSMGLWSHFTMTKSSPKTFLHQSKRTEVLICAFLQQKHPLQGFLEDNCFTILCYFLLYNNICDSPCLQNWDHIISLIYLPSHHISENLPCSVCVCVCVSPCHQATLRHQESVQNSTQFWLCLPGDSIGFHRWRAQSCRPYPHYTDFRCPSQVQVCHTCFW